MTIFNTLSKTFGSKYRNYKGDIGLEVETESKTEYIPPKMSFWGVHADNSLRDFGIEYVLKQPLDYEDNFKKALEEFKDKTKEIKFIQDSVTTSVHVHLNILNDNFITLGNFLTAYTLTENLLIRFSGEDRLSNLFCLPIVDAEEIVENMVEMMVHISKNNFSKMGFSIDQTKYGAINLSSIQNYGSIELRSFKGTTDTDLIYTWVGILYRLLQFARTPGLYPPHIIMSTKDKGTKVLEEIFGPFRDTIKHVDEEKLIEKNFWHAARVAYSVKDWKALIPPEKPKKLKPKDLDTISKKLYGVNFESLSHAQQQIVMNTGAKAEVPAGGETVVVTGGNYTYDPVTAGTAWNPPRGATAATTDYRYATGTAVPRIDWETVRPRDIVDLDLDRDAELRRTGIEDED